jgi:hypothetical protein
MTALTPLTPWRCSIGHVGYEIVSPDYSIQNMGLLLSEESDIFAR